MFKKLRNQFLLLHMGVVSLLIALFFGTLLLITYNVLERTTDVRADLAMRSRTYTPSVTIAALQIPNGEVFTVASAQGQPQGQPQGQGQSHEQSQSQNQSQSQSQTQSQTSSPSQSQDQFQIQPQTQAQTQAQTQPQVQTQPQTRESGISFFRSSVPLGMRIQSMPGIYIIADEKSYDILQVESAYDMDNTFYVHITNAAYQMGKPAGKVQVDNIALKYRRLTGGGIVFVDITTEESLFTGMVRLFLMIAMPLLGMLFLLSLFFANRSIRPIEASYNRQKEFIADASHELKTPLAVIATNLDVLHETAVPEQLKWLDYIRSEVGRMAGLTNSLLYLAKMDYGMAEEHLPVDFGRLLTDVWLPLEAVLYEKGCDITIDIAEDVQVQGDEEQLRKLLSILADNALRYAARQIAVTLTKTQTQVVLTVANDGRGIAPEDMKKIWERFYRCDPSRRYDGGFGLGLPMAKAITERHKGRITCESGGGLTTFKVVLNKSGNTM